MLELFGEIRIPICVAGIAVLWKEYFTNSRAKRPTSSIFVNDTPRHDFIYEIINLYSGDLFDEKSYDVSNTNVNRQLPGNGL